MRMIILLLAIVASLTSCFSSRKIKDSSHRKVDSVAVSSSEKAAVVKTDSTANRIDEVSDTEEGDLKLFFSNEDTAVNNIAGFGRNGTAEEYLPQPEKKSFRYKINGNTVEADRPLDSAVVRFKKSGTHKKAEVISIRKLDSSGFKKSDSIVVASTETRKTKEVKKTGSSWATWGIVLLVICSFAAAGYKFRIFKFFKHGQNHNRADTKAPPGAQG
jgi:hypothetical protein